MEKFNENPVDCFGWKATFGNFIEGSGEAPMFEIELYGFYKEGSAIDPGKLSNILRLIEDRMNGREGEVKMYTTNTTDSIINNYMKEYDNAMEVLGRYSSYYNHPVPEIKNVIFNPPATIVFWNDGTKTVVKCDERDQFDPEKGITMAFFKKMHGNKGHYFEEIKKWTEKYESSEQYKLLLFLKTMM